MYKRFCVEIESEPPVDAGIRGLPGDPGEFSTDPEEDQSAFFSLPGRSLTGMYVYITILIFSSKRQANFILKTKL